MKHVLRIPTPHGAIHRVSLAKQLRGLEWRRTIRVYSGGYVERTYIGPFGLTIFWSTDYPHWATQPKQPQPRETSKIVVCDPADTPPLGPCLTCEREMSPDKKFLRVMAVNNEAAPNGTVADECYSCAKRYGRAHHFSNGGE